MNKLINLDVPRGLGLLKNSLSNVCLIAMCTTYDVGVNQGPWCQLTIQLFKIWIFIAKYL